MRRAISAEHLQTEARAQYARLRLRHESARAEALAELRASGALAAVGASEFDDGRRIAADDVRPRTRHDGNETTVGRGSSAYRGKKSTMRNGVDVKVDRKLLDTLQARAKSYIVERKQAGTVSSPRITSKSPGVVLERARQNAAEIRRPKNGR
jgi:hypothetical protein